MVKWEILINYFSRTWLWNVSKWLLL